MNDQEIRDIKNYKNSWLQAEKKAHSFNIQL